ncbi:hypothetical protein ACWCY1_22330 [Streptomyces goshikiensis]
MHSSKPELVWQGRVHLGDEPGVFDDAHYSGLTVELPITLQKINTSGPDVTTLLLVSQNVETFAGYPGHLITVTQYRPDPHRPNHCTETVLTTARLESSDHNRKEVALNLANQPTSVYVGVRVHIDTDVPPGLYDDFVLTQLLNKSESFTFAASLGFHA